MKLVRWYIVLLVGGFATTGLGVDYFTQRFNDQAGETFDLLNKSITFTPDGSVDFYSANVEEVDELPTPFSTHQLRGIQIYNSLEVLFEDGKTFEFYGVSYDRVHIGAHGYLTFGSGDWYYIADTSWHFSRPRISGLMSYLRPTQSSRIYGEQLSDRFVVTVEDMPQNGAYNWFTFQMEIFFDDGRIRLSWSRIDNPAMLCIVGLSRGGYQPADYVETDLSTLVRDYDEDGMLDKWENAHFGHYSNCVASVDFDGDGFDNRSEFICGTLPKDKDSFLWVKLDDMPSGAMLSWESVEGRRYKILRSGNLAADSYAEIDTVEFPLNSYTNTSGDVGFFKIGAELID